MMTKNISGIKLPNLLNTVPLATNNSLHQTAISLLSIAAGELWRYREEDPSC